MTKKGFTLVELLAVIVILGVLLAITVPSVNKVLGSSKAKLYDSAVEEIDKAAKMYTVKYSDEIEGLSDKEYGYITVEDMIDKGVLDSTVTNPKTGDSFNSSAVKVTKLPNGTYQFDFLIDGIPD